MNEFRSLLTARLDGVRTLTTSELSLLEAHYLLLREWNRRLNLTSIHGLEAIVERHYCESVFLAGFLPQDPLEIVDVGSGPGFPGLPIAVVRPDCRVSLVESSGKKAVFLREASRDLGNVRVIESRAEALTLKYNWIVSRAVQWRSIVKLTPRVANRVALLIGENDFIQLRQTASINWARPVLLPWGARRILAQGFHVERDRM